MTRNGGFGFELLDLRDGPIPDFEEQDFGGITVIVCNRCASVVYDPNQHRLSHRHADTATES